MCSGIHLRWIYNKFLDDIHNVRHLSNYVKDFTGKTLTFQEKVTEAINIEDQIQKCFDGI